MNILSRNINPNGRVGRFLVRHTEALFWLVVIGVGCIIAFTIGHNNQVKIESAQAATHTSTAKVGSASPVKAATTTSKPKDESVKDNVYTVGQAVYCWDGDKWYPCTVIGIEDNHQQYFINAPTDKGHEYFHVSGKNITASGTYKGAY